MRLAAARALACALIAAPALAGPARAEAVAVPSGQAVTLQDVVWGEPGDEELTVRFRFIAPAIGGGVDFDAAAADMQHLCDSYALPRALTAAGPAPARIVISLADRPVEFGAAAPEARQFIEVYSVDGGACRWEPF